MNVSSVKNLNGEVLSAVQDASLTNVIQTNSGNWQDITAYQNASAKYLTGVYIPESAVWQDVSTTVQTNSANWSEGVTGGSKDSFYIYPGITTNKEVADNSGKDIYLYHSGTNTYLKYAGKITYPKYGLFNFKTVSGEQYNSNKLVNARVEIYPNSTSACKIKLIESIDLLDTNSTANYANTAYTAFQANYAKTAYTAFAAYDDVNGNSLVNTYKTVTALSSFVESNSANWVGGSSPTGGEAPVVTEVSHDNTLSGNGTVESPLGIANGYIKFLSVNQPYSANDYYYNSTALVPNGYEFLCWVNMCTNGFSQIFYPIDPYSTICTWWLGGSSTNPHPDDTVDSRYLVIKKN